MQNKLIGRHKNWTTIPASLLTVLMCFECALRTFAGCYIIPNGPLCAGTNVNGNLICAGWTTGSPPRACQAIQYYPTNSTYCGDGYETCGQTDCTDGTTISYKRVRNGWCIGSSVCFYGDWEPDENIGQCDRALLSGAECGSCD